MEHKEIENKFFDCIKAITREKYLRYVDSITGAVTEIDNAPQIKIKVGGVAV